MPILVFKTNIRYKKDLQKITPALNMVPGIRRWNIDRQDVDKVLRIEAVTADTGELIKTLNREGFTCEELPG
ncbi:MAG TPA: hypothetical protein VK644_10710 [Chitinophagaceae bacterium]|nr:hypothetical protein [Chitinophagaceae bacterium]